jgi:hypothetical protein
LDLNIFCTALGSSYPVSLWNMVRYA